MVDQIKSRQTEGYDLYDYAEVAFQAAGGVEAVYLVGTRQNALIQGAWPSQTGVYLPNPAYLPFDAHSTQVYATVPCFIRLINNALTAQMVGGILPLGLPVQIAIPAGAWFNLPDKWWMMQIIGSGVAGGTLSIKSSG